jgi:multidrug efflux pump subunit AcrA (membrane-fusion protein)
VEVAHVFSPVTGRITAINAELGQRVKKGQALAVIDSPDLDLALSNLQKADADLLNQSGHELRLFDLRGSQPSLAVRARLGLCSVTFTAATAGGREQAKAGQRDHTIHVAKADQ